MSVWHLTFKLFLMANTVTYNKVAPGCGRGVEIGLQGAVQDVCVSVVVAVNVGWWGRKLQRHRRSELPNE